MYRITHFFIELFQYAILLFFPERKRAHLQKYSLKMPKVERKSVTWCIVILKQKDMSNKIYPIGIQNFEKIHDRPESLDNCWKRYCPIGKAFTVRTPLNALSRCVSPEWNNLPFINPLPTGSHY